MSRYVIKLIDQSRALLATAQVAEEEDGYGGTIDLRCTPTDLRDLFDEFEEIVNGQMFSFLDDIQGRIDRLPIRAVFEGGLEIFVKDLQIYPSTGDVSFKVDAPSGESGKPT